MLSFKNLSHSRNFGSNGGYRLDRRPRHAGVIYLTRAGHYTQPACLVLSVPNILLDEPRDGVWRTGLVSSEAGIWRRNRQSYRGLHCSRIGGEWNPSTLAKVHGQIRRAAGLPKNLQLQDSRTTFQTEGGAAGGTVD
jgi:hypothetical protein